VYARVADRRPIVYVETEMASLMTVVGIDSRWAEQFEDYCSANSQALALVYKSGVGEVHYPGVTDVR
jgi:hypothetical protein